MNWGRVKRKRQVYMDIRVYGVCAAMDGCGDTISMVAQHRRASRAVKKTRLENVDVNLT